MFHLLWLVACSDPETSGGTTDTGTPTEAPLDDTATESATADTGTPVATTPLTYVDPLFRMVFDLYTTSVGPPGLLEECVGTLTLTRLGDGTTTGAASCTSSVEGYLYTVETNGGVEPDGQASGTLSIAKKGADWVETSYTGFAEEDFHTLTFGSTIVLGPNTSVDVDGFALATPL